jgi:hypothetical protein
MQEKHEKALGAKAEAYRRAKEAAQAATDELAEAIRAAYADGEQQAAIVRATGHVYTREYVRVILGLAKRKAE